MFQLSLLFCIYDTAFSKNFLHEDFYFSKAIYIFNFLVEANLMSESRLCCQVFFLFSVVGAHIHMLFFKHGEFSLHEIQTPRKQEEQARQKKGGKVVVPVFETSSPSRFPVLCWIMSWA